MKALAVVLLLVFLGVVGLMAWVRLAPSDVARWHGRVSFTKDETREGAAVRVLASADAAGLLSQLDRIAMATPRTTRLAGSVGEGSVTYVTRSAFWGFPDYTTITASGERVVMFARLRFGKSDFGVNAARLDGWISQLPDAGAS